MGQTPGPQRPRTHGPAAHHDAPGPGHVAGGAIHQVATAARSLPRGERGRIEGKKQPAHNPGRPGHEAPGPGHELATSPAALMCSRTRRRRPGRAWPAGQMQHNATPQRARDRGPRRCHRRRWARAKPDKTRHLKTRAIAAPAAWSIRHIRHPYARGAAWSVDRSDTFTRGRSGPATRHNRHLKRGRPRRRGQGRAGCPTGVLQVSYSPATPPSGLTLALTPASSSSASWA